MTIVTNQALPVFTFQETSEDLSLHSLVPQSL